MIINRGPLGFKEFDFTFQPSGSSSKYTKANLPSSYGRYAQTDHAKDWELHLFVSGTLSFEKRENFDFFMVDAGEKGSPTTTKTDFPSDANSCVGGKGGNGGSRRTVSNQVLDAKQSITCVVGTATVANNSRATSVKYSGVTYKAAEDGSGEKTGGPGAIVGRTSGNASAEAGKDGDKAFSGSSLINDCKNMIYGSSGGGGGARSRDGNSKADGAKGGVNAGKGGSWNNNSGLTAGASNTGSGGGGGGADRVDTTATRFPGGDGANGRIIFRKHK